VDEKAKRVIIMMIVLAYSFKLSLVLISDSDLSDGCVSCQLFHRALILAVTLLWLNDKSCNLHAAKVSEEVNRKCHARNTTLQFPVPYTLTLSAAMQFVTDRRTDRQTDHILMSAADQAS